MSTKNLRLRQMTFNETFQSSLVQHNKQKFTIDKSLINGIKQNDVNKIIEQNSVPAPVQSSSKQQYSQVKQISDVIVDTRKRYDQLKTTSTKCQHDIEKLKAQKQSLVQDQTKYQKLVDEQKKQLDQTSKRFQEVTNLLEQILYQRDTYFEKKDVVKHDLLVLKKRYFDKDVKLMRSNTKAKLLKSEHDSKVKLSQKCRQVLLSVQKTVQVRQIERAQQIQSVFELLNKKQATVQNRQITRRQIETATVLGMTERLPEQKQMIKMYQANLLAKNVLRYKMERQMNKYNKTQICFHKIKQGSTVKDSKQFIQRYLNREKDYADLLKTIQQKQKTVDILKKQKAQLAKLNSHFILKNEQITEQFRKAFPKNKASNDHSYNVLEELIEQLQRIQKQKQLMYQWSSKFLASFFGQTNRDRVFRKYPKQRNKQLFIETLKTINKFITQLQKQQDQNKKVQQILLKDNPKQFSMTKEIMEKNTRIKTLTTYQNQRGQDNFQDKDVAYDDLSELDYLQYNRRALKKNQMQNRKFRIKTKPN